MDIDYSESLAEQGPKNPRVVDQKGNETKLSDYQKTKLYDQAKKLRSEIEGSLCSKEECRTPTDQSVRKMIHSEFKAKEKVEEFKKVMKAIGADPRDYNVERFRR